MERLYATYKDQIEFLIVYIREAHPEMLREGHKTGVVGRPKDIDERLILATECVSQFKFTIPMVIDGMEGTVNSDYAAAPVRTTITDRDGKVAYYAGPGPFDFRLSKVESVLKKLVAGNGYMPPPPKPVWGKTVGGLRCGVTFDPGKIKIGDEVAVQVKFENASKDLIELYFNPTDAIKHLEFKNGKGQVLKMEQSRSMRMFSRMRRGGRRGGSSAMRPRRLALGDTYETVIEGKIIAPESGGMSAGAYKAVFNFEVGKETLAAIQNVSTEDAWRGKLSSGAFPFELEMTRQLACMDCHGDGDYHHEQEEDCTICHIGEEGTEEFTVNKKACSKCHPREGVQGRRQILGPGGEFDQVSVHIPGKVKDSQCLKCHDHSSHRKGVVRLLDPHSTTGQRQWRGSINDFCLACHDGNPPGGVTFPAAKGSGYNKSKVSCRASHGSGNDCTQCHTSHGSPHRPMLKEEYTGSGSPK
jgi:predicted CXXCH cytochrome family protein